MVIAVLVAFFGFLHVTWTNEAEAAKPRPRRLSPAARQAVARLIVHDTQTRIFQFLAQELGAESARDSEVDDAPGKKEASGLQAVRGVVAGTLVDFAGLRTELLTDLQRHEVGDASKIDLEEVRADVVSHAAEVATGFHRVSISGTMEPMLAKFAATAAARLARFASDENGKLPLLDRVSLDSLSDLLGHDPE